MPNNNRSFWASIMPVTKHLLVINVIMWLATMVCQQIGIIDLHRWLGLHFWKGSEFNVLQLFTYMFMHANFTHLFFNMFSLWMFGSLLERVLGSKRYLFYYISWVRPWSRSWCGSSRGRISWQAAFRDRPLDRWPTSSRPSTRGMLPLP